MLKCIFTQIILLRCLSFVLDNVSHFLKHWWLFVACCDSCIFSVILSGKAWFQHHWADEGRNSYVQSILGVYRTQTIFKNRMRLYCSGQIILTHRCYRRRSLMLKEARLILNKIMQKHNISRLEYLLQMTLCKTHPEIPNAIRAAL